MAIRLWGSKTPGNAQNSRDITLLRNKKRVSGRDEAEIYRKFTQ